MDLVGTMHDLDGSPATLRRLITETLLPQLQAMAGRRDRTIGVAEGAEKPGRQAAVESHHFPELCFCLAGEAEIWIGPGVRQLKQGDILVIPPRIAHSTPGPHCITRNPALVSSRLLWVRTFPYGAVLNLCRTSGGLHQSTVHQVFLHRRIHASVERLIEELQEPQFGHHEMAACHITEALTWIYRGTDIGSAAVPEAHSNVSAGEECLASQAARFIQESFDAALNLDVIARAVGTNKSQLCREFRRHYDITVMEHVARVRIDASKRLLQARMRVADAAQFVGFPDPYHFSRVFKKITGQSPKQFSDAQYAVKVVRSSGR
jgi:AraC-like DNA-binding protein